MKEKTLKKYIRKASVELWRAKFAHSNIRIQLKMLKLTLMRFLAFANDNVFSPIIPRMPMLVKSKKSRRAWRIFRK